jgi:hypothetical protein
MNEHHVDYKALSIGLLVLIVIIILFNAIKIQIPTERTSTQLKPYVVLDYYTAQEKYINGTCVYRNFSYSYKWVGWEAGNSEYTTPFIELSNDENESGIYVVQFAFFDSSKYPYATFKDRITWEDASMYSIEENFSLGPFVKKTISIPTGKASLVSTYWAIGDIKAPVLADCGNNTVLKTVTKNRTTTELRNIERVDVIANRVSIWNYIFGNY